jgi:hypothetical protein
MVRITDLTAAVTDVHPNGSASLTLTILARPRPLSEPLVTRSRAHCSSDHRFQNPCDGMRNARLKREDAFSHAMIIVSSAMVSSS